MKPLRCSVVAAVLAVLATGLYGPAAAETVCYRADADSGEIKFHFKIERSAFTGRFGDFQINYCMQDADPEAGDITVEVDVASVRTGNRDLDIGIQEAEAMDVDNYPKAKWTTRSISREGDVYFVKGELSIRGKTLEEAGQFQLKQLGDGWRMTGSSDIKRLDYEVGIGEFEDTEFIPNEIKVEFDFTLGTED